MNTLEITSEIGQTTTVRSLFKFQCTHPIPGSMYDGGYMGVGLGGTRNTNISNNSLRNIVCVLLVLYDNHVIHRDL